MPEKVGLTNLLIGKAARAGEGLPSQPVGMFPAGRIALRNPLEHGIGVEVGEKPTESGCIHYLNKFVGIVVDTLSQRLEQFGFRAPDTSSKHTTIGLQVEIVAAIGAFLSPVCRQECSEPLLIGPLIGRKAHITIDAPNTILW